MSVLEKLEGSSSSGLHHSLGKAWKIPSRDWSRTNALRHMRGRKWAQPRDTEPGRLSMSSYNGVIGEQQTFLKPEGGEGRGKKISPAGQLRMRPPVFGDSILCSVLPGKGQ